MSLTSQNQVKVTITRDPNGNVVTVTAPGPQGPAGPQGAPFPGGSFLDTTAIGALTSADAGKVLKYNGTTFAPTDELNDNLTITGGNF